MIHKSKNDPLGTKNTVICALFASVICVISPLSLPIGPIPLSLCNFSVMLTAVILGPTRAAFSVTVFLLLGLSGLPVFSGGAGGIGHLLSPAGGYIISYPLSAVLTGLFSTVGKRHAPNEKDFRTAAITFIGCILSVSVSYAIGTAWYSLSSGIPLSARLLQICVLPFLPFDALKCIAAAALGHVISSRICKNIIL